MFGIGFDVPTLAVRCKASGAAGPTLPALSGLIGLYDAADVGTLAQNSNGTGAVAIGDPVGHWASAGMGPVNVSQSTAGRRPILQSDGSRYWFECDGSDDMLENTSVAVSPSFTIVMAVHVEVINNYTSGVFSLDAANDFQIQSAHSSQMRFGVGASNLGFSMGAQSVDYANQDLVMTFSLDAVAGTAVLRLNGAVVNTQTGYNGGLSATQKMRFMVNRGAGNEVGGRLYRAAVWNGAANVEIAAAETWVGAGAGLSL